MIKNILQLLNNNAGILAVLALAGSAFRYIHLQTRESNQRQFEEYHRLIEQLVGTGDPKATYIVERLMAIIFELRNFPRYYQFTIRVLTDLRALLEIRSRLETSDAQYINPDYARRLQREIDHTMKFIKQKRFLLCFKRYNPE